MPARTEEQTALSKQPLYEQRSEGSTLRDVQVARDKVRGASLLKVAQPGRAGTSKLPRTKAGVPVADIRKFKVSKRIPRLDIGTENLISREEFGVDGLSIGLSEPSELKRLPAVPALPEGEFRKILGAPVAKVLGAKGLQANIRTVGKPVSQETIAKVKYEITDVKPYQPRPYKPLSEEHLKMVAALLLFEKGNQCHMIMGLFHQLAQAEKTKTEATYHLGACAHQMGMSQSAFDNLSFLVGREDKEWGAMALDLLAKDLPLIYEKDFYKILKNVKSFKNLVTDKSQDAVAYRLAKGAYRSGDYKTSLTYAGRVNSGTEYYNEARFLAAMNSFALGDKAGALKKLEELAATQDAGKGGSSGNMKALISVNLGRMYFAQKKYDKALENYMKVPKDHALWVNALIEQGWTQLALEDYSGAIGNMYSLHSPYFKAVYQPESFVVRSIGYLNICQYGDAYKTLSWIEKDYRDWFDKTNQYLSRKSEPVAIYNTVKSYIKGKSDTSVEGVPYQIWREMARRKDFLNLQTALNDKQDEATRYNGINEKIKAEKASIRWHAEQAKKRFDQWKNQLAKIKKDRSLAKNQEEWLRNLRRERDLTIGYRFELQMLELGRQGYLDFQKKSQAKLDSETTTLTARTGDVLLKRVKTMKDEMSRVLENNEFLRYEVFAGSGETIRYQVAGGAVGALNRVPASIKPTKMMNWSFDGEFWEDEIGSYRSALNNVCPTAQAKLMEE
ncbi:MAG: hypothetical protein HC902_09270 [Calothrix sp. SM1_5_4]|nr:hypothetical protein [Calothrix sp. SM1_5_4]